MKYPSTFIPYRRGPSAAQLMRKPRDASEFLRSDNAMAALLPAISRMASLQKNCVAVLPAIFKSCDVMHFGEGQLVLSTPNAALAAKLKQQLPKLQEHLLKSGWQVNAIRIKVQVAREEAPVAARRQLALPALAVSAFAELNATLEDSPRNQTLKQALANMVRRNGGTG